MIARFPLILLLCLWAVRPAFATGAESGEDAQSISPLPGVALAESVSATTGIAISPLLGVAALGVWQYMHAAEDDRPGLPWHAQPWFWGSALVIVALLAFKDPISGLLPFADKPLDVVEIFENKASALIAAPVVLTLVERVFREAAAGGNETALALGGWDGGGWLGPVLVGGLLLVVFGAVWLVSQAVNFLILLSPSAFVDVLLRGARGTVFAGVGLAALINPWLGLLVAIPVIWLAFRCSGWAWRLMLYGMTLIFDWLRRVPGGPDASGRVRAFMLAGSKDVPKRTRGHLCVEDGALVFCGRPSPWAGIRRVVLGDMRRWVVRGFPGPEVRSGEGVMVGARFALPPRFRGREEVVKSALQLDAVEDGALVRAWRSASMWWKGEFGSQGGIFVEAATFSKEDQGAQRLSD